jgi:hypothetical protein
MVTITHIAPSATNVFIFEMLEYKLKNQICKSWTCLDDNVLNELSIVVEQFENNPMNTLNIQ